MINSTLTVNFIKSKIYIGEAPKQNTTVTQKRAAATSASRS